MRSLYDGFAAGDPVAVMAILGAEIEWTECAGYPYAGTCVGPDAVAENVFKRLAKGRPYTMLSPYPGLSAPISLQSWGHQLKVEEAADPRIDQFIRALRANPNTHPEPGASCTIRPQNFDVDAPPPFGS